MLTCTCTSYWFFKHYPPLSNIIQVLASSSLISSFHLVVPTGPFDVLLWFEWILVFLFYVWILDFLYFSSYSRSHLEMYILHINIHKIYSMLVKLKVQIKYICFCLKTTYIVLQFLLRNRTLSILNFVFYCS